MINTEFYGNQKRIQMFTPYTEEEITRMMKEAKGEIFEVSTERKAKAICTHKRDNKVIVKQNSDGTLYCPICGKTFNGYFTDKEVKETVKRMLDIMEVIKLYYITATKEILPYYEIFLQ